MIFLMNTAADKLKTKMMMILENLLNYSWRKTVRWKILRDYFAWREKKNEVSYLQSASTKSVYFESKKMWVGPFSHISHITFFALYGSYNLKSVWRKPNSLMQSFLTELPPIRRFKLQKVKFIKIQRRASKTAAKITSKIDAIYSW